MRFAPDASNTLAAQIGEVAAELKTIGVSDAIEDMRAALPGTGLGDLCTQAAEAIADAHSTTAGRCNHLAEQVITTAAALTAIDSNTPQHIRNSFAGDVHSAPP